MARCALFSVMNETTTMAQNRSTNIMSNKIQITPRVLLKLFCLMGTVTWIACPVILAICV